MQRQRKLRRPRLHISNRQNRRKSRQETFGTVGQSSKGKLVKTLEDFDKDTDGKDVAVSLNANQVGFLFRMLNSVHTAAHLLHRTEELKVIHEIGESLEKGIDNLMVQFEEYPGQYNELVDKALEKQNLGRDDCTAESPEMPIGNYL